MADDLPLPPPRTTPPALSLAVRLRRAHGALAPLVLAPLVVTVSTGVSYRLLRDWGGMDREQAHTRHCAACSGALRAIRRWRPVVATLPWLALLAIAWWHTPLALAVGGAVAAAAGALLRQLGLWEQALLTGNARPPRNLGGGRSWGPPPSLSRRPSSPPDGPLPGSAPAPLPPAALAPAARS